MLDVLAAAPPPASVSHVHPELGGEQNPVPATRQHFAEECLTAPRATVDVGGVEERDAVLERGIDHRARPVEIDAAGEVVAAKPYRRAFESGVAQRALRERRHA